MSLDSVSRVAFAAGNGSVVIKIETDTTGVKYPNSWQNEPTSHTQSPLYQAIVNQKN